MAMQYAQEMQQKMMQGGGPTSMTPKLVTNIPNTNYNPMKSGGGTLNGNIKFDDILISSFDKIIDLQMKPSFAELIREMAPSVMDHKSGIIFKNRSEFDNISIFRKSILIDPEDPKTQFNYLIAFLKICEKKFKTNRKDEIVRLKFLTTAYNYGINKSTEQTESMIDRKFFNTKLFKTENYSYADVSLFWYKQFMAGK